MERRINRVTAAVWHFSSGAVGSLTHSLVLHTSHYQTGQPPHTSPHASWQLSSHTSCLLAAQFSHLMPLGSSMLRARLMPLDSSLLRARLMPLGSSMLLALLIPLGQLNVDTL